MPCSRTQHASPLRGLNQRHMDHESRALLLGGQCQPQATSDVMPEAHIFA